MPGMHFRLREVPRASLPFWVYVITNCDSNGHVTIPDQTFRQLAKRTKHRPPAETLKALLSPHLTVRKHNQSLMRYVPLGALEYDAEKEGSAVKAWLHPDLLVHLDELKAEVEQNDLTNTSKLRGLYAQNLYRLVNSKLREMAASSTPAPKLKGFPDPIKVEIEIDELRRTLEVPKTSYNAYSDLKRFVLGNALLQINRRTDIDLVFTNGRKKGRHFISMILSVRIKVPGSKPKSVAEFYKSVPARSSSRAAKPALKKILVPKPV